MAKNNDIFIVNDIEFSSISQIGITLKVLMDKKDILLTTSQITNKAAKIYKQKTGKTYAEITGRAIRKLHQEGLIQRESKGIYIYTGVFSKSKLNEFSPQQREIILKRDNYTCVFCGKSEKEGALLTADHIKPQWYEGEADISNGQTLCTACENRKSNYDLNSFGKKMFEKYLKVAKKNRDEDTEKFIVEILKVFQKHEQI